MSSATIGCGSRSMTPVRSPPRSAERTTWRCSAAAGWSWWTRWPVGGAPWEAPTGGWSGSSWTSAPAEAGPVTHPALNLAAKLAGFVSEPFLPALFVSRMSSLDGSRQQGSPIMHGATSAASARVRSWSWGGVGPQQVLLVGLMPRRRPGSWLLAPCSRRSWPTASGWSPTRARSSSLGGVRGYRPGQWPGPPRPRSAAQCCADSLAGPSLIRSLRDCTGHLGRRAPGPARATLAPGWL
jgi:hypothetical protein